MLNVVTALGADLGNGDFDQLIEEHLANEAAILRGLTDSDRRSLERLLAALNRTLDSGDSGPAGGGPTG